MKIHELNNYTGGLGSNSFLAVDNGNDTGKLSTQQLLASTDAEIAELGDTLNARIDNIIAGGTAPSEAEVTDARLGADGVDYASLGAAIRSQVSDLTDNLDFRTLWDAQAITEFAYQGGSFTGLVADVPTSPYYLGGTRINVVDFTLTLNAGQNDFWCGVEIDNYVFIGGNSIGANRAYRRVPNQTNTASIIDDMDLRTRLYPGNTYDVRAFYVDHTFIMMANGAIVQRFDVPANENIAGIAFLNLGLVSGNITNMVGYQMDKTILRQTVRAYENIITDSIVSDNGWTSFKDFPINRTYRVNVSAANFETLGFPIKRAGTFFAVSPNVGSVADYAYRTYFYVCNDAYEINHVFVCFGHGVNFTPWSSIDAMNGAGNINSFASAIINGDKIAFIGDSIIAGLGGSNYDATASGGGDFLINYGVDRYVNLLGTCWVNSMISYIATVYGNSNVVNHGVGGITTAGLYNNFDALVGDAKMVIISVGTNNHDNLSQLRNYLPQIAKKCVQGGIKFMIMTNTPNNTADKDEYNAVKGNIVAVCNSIGIPVYDMYSEFEMYLDLKGIALADVLNPDGIHPNDTGYGIMFKIAKKLFEI